MERICSSRRFFPLRIDTFWKNFIAKSARVINWLLLKIGGKRRGLQILDVARNSRYI